METEVRKMSLLEGAHKAHSQPLEAVKGRIPDPPLCSPEGTQLDFSPVRPVLDF